MLISTKEEHIAFLQKLLQKTRQIIDLGNICMATLSLAQIIEIIGSYIDEKPLRSREQSANRFNSAIYRFYPMHYSKANRKSFLYYQLRTSLVHTLLPTESISIKSGKSKSHLVETNDIMEVYVESLYCDTEKAIEILTKRILEDKIKLKKISAGEIENF